jgi:hypothetical protein
VPSDGDEAVIPKDFPTRNPATRADLVLLEATPANWSELEAQSRPQGGSVTADEAGVRYLVVAAGRG